MSTYDDNTGDDFISSLRRQDISSHDIDYVE